MPHHNASRTLLGALFKLLGGSGLCCRDDIPLFQTWYPFRWQGTSNGPVLSPIRHRYPLGGYQSTHPINL
jgi:hypothetical protein